MPSFGPAPARRLILALLLLAGGGCAADLSPHVRAVQQVAEAAGEGARQAAALARAAPLEQLLLVAASDPDLDLRFDPAACGLATSDGCVVRLQGPPGRVPCGRHGVCRLVSAPPGAALDTALGTLDAYVQSLVRLGGPRVVKNTEAGANRLGVSGAAALVADGVLQRSRHARLRVAVRAAHPEVMRLARMLGALGDGLAASAVLAHANAAGLAARGFRRTADPGFRMVLARVVSERAARARALTLDPPARRFQLLEAAHAVLLEVLERPGRAAAALDELETIARAAREDRTGGEEAPG